MPPAGAPEKAPPAKPSAKPNASSYQLPAVQAKLVVSLPADAKLYVDDQLMKATSARRVFRTPQLEAGQAYYYVLRAEVVREGKALAQTKRVIIRPGEDAEASFADLGQSAPKTVASTTP
jgi:uncharacterized protein (TIGR03000 family)